MPGCVGGGTPWTYYFVDATGTPVEGPFTDGNSAAFWQWAANHGTVPHHKGALWLFAWDQDGQQWWPMRQPGDPKPQIGYVTMPLR